MGDFKDILKSEAQKHRIQLSPENVQEFSEFRTELLKWNEKVNLTNITKPKDFAKKHIVDSLILTKYIDIGSNAKVIDIGTGAGIPGLIIKIYRPDIDLTLVESISKKTKFIDWIVQDMNFTNVKVINDRAENVGHDMVYREKYDIVVARAVSALNTLLEYCLPFAKTGGIFVAMKGGAPEDELHASKRALKLLGGNLEKCHKYTLNDLERSLVVVLKTRVCPKKYPRKPGMPKKTPL